MSAREPEADLRQTNAIAVVVLIALFVLALLTTSCASVGRSQVADYSAERIYQEDRYERACVQIKGPAGCAEFQSLLALLERHEKRPDGTVVAVGLIPVANDVQKVGGQLPDQERAELDKVFARARKLP